MPITLTGKNFKPSVRPVESESTWRDTRPSPTSVHAGRYTPVVGEPKTNGIGCYVIVPASPKKPRGTV